MASFRDEKYFSSRLIKLEYVSKKFIARAHELLWIWMFLTKERKVINFAAMEMESQLISYTHFVDLLKFEKFCLASLMENHLDNCCFSMIDQIFLILSSKNLFRFNLQFVLKQELKSNIFRTFFVQKIKENIYIWEFLSPASSYTSSIIHDHFRGLFVCNMKLAHSCLMFVRAVEIAKTLLGLLDRRQLVATESFKKKRISSFHFHVSRIVVKLFWCCDQLILASCSLLYWDQLQSEHTFEKYPRFDLWTVTANT